MPISQFLTPALDFSNVTDVDLLIRGRGHYEGMHANPDFHHPPVPYETYKSTLDRFEAAITAALDGSKIAIAERNSIRNELILQTRDLGHYVEIVAKDNLEIFLNSKFTPIPQKRSKSKPLETPRILKIEHGAFGELLIWITPLDRPRQYELRYAPKQPDGLPDTWTTHTFTRARWAIRIGGLQPGTAYVFQVRAFSVHGHTDWSDPVERFCA